jgi:flagellar biosynthesis protein FlhG
MDRMSKKSGQEWLLSNNDYNKSKLEPGTKVDSRSGQSEKEEVNNFRLTKAHTISVTGGKGGVGKSSVTIKLGKILAQFGFRVLIFDCDYNLSNITVKLGYPLNNNFYDLINNYKTFEECVLRIDNLHILPGCNGNLDLFKKDILFDQFVINLLMNQEKKYDFILLDCPAGARKEYLTMPIVTIDFW